MQVTSLFPVLADVTVVEHTDDDDACKESRLLRAGEGGMSKLLTRELGR